MQGQKDVTLQLKDTAHATTNAKCRLNNVTTEWSVCLCSYQFNLIKRRVITEIKFTPMQAKKSNGGSGRTSLFALKVGSIRSCVDRLCYHTTRAQKVRGTQPTGGWLRPKIGLGRFGERDKILLLLGIGPRLLSSSP